MNQLNWRKAIGALKDSTKVGLAKVNSDYKKLDIAIAKATTHTETLPSEKYICKIFEAISSSRPRADVAHCINALVGRLVKTHNWAVSLKILIIIHRAIREVDATFREELVTRTKDLILNLSDFKDDSSSEALEYSAWVCSYALYIGERLECIDVTQYDIWTESAKTSELKSADLLSHLPALQLLLLRVLNCQPEGAAVHNKMIQYALSIVVSESFKIYDAISGCIRNLVDKFFDMKRHEALRAVEIYRKAEHQALRLSAFYDLCKYLDLGYGIKYIKLEQLPASFLDAMEEFIKDESQKQIVYDVECPPSPVLAIEDKVISEHEKAEIESIDSIQSSDDVTATQALAPIQAPFPDLLSFDDFSQNATALEDNNTFALAIVSNENSVGNTNNSDLINGTVGWELALDGALSSDESAVPDSKPVGGLDKQTLYSLYDGTVSTRSNYHLRKAASNPFEDPFFFASDCASPVTNVQTDSASQHLRSMSANHAENPFTPMDGYPYPSHNSNCNIPVSGLL